MLRIDYLALRIGVMVSAFVGQGCTCNDRAAVETTDVAEAGPSLPELAQAGRPAVVDGEWHCVSRLALLAMGRTIPFNCSVRVFPGDGVSAYCLGDPFDRHAVSLLPQGCDSRCRIGETDLEFTNHVLSSVRVHLGGRKSRSASLGLSKIGTGCSYGLSDDLYLGMSEAQVAARMPPPKRRHRVRDPEFGEIEQLEFDGVVFELEEADGGRVVAAMKVVPKSE